jgi:hypothetical protein
MKKVDLVGRRRALGLFALGGAALVAASCSDGGEEGEGDEEGEDDDEGGRGGRDD